MSTIRSIRLRATLLICGFILAVIVVYAAAAYREMKTSAIADAGARLHHISGELAGNLERSTGRMKRTLATLAEDPSIVGYLQDPSTLPQPALDALLAQELRGAADESWLGIELRDAAGRRILATWGPSPGDTESFDSDLKTVGRDTAPAAIAPFLTMGDTVYYAVLGRVRESGATIGYVVRWRRLATIGESRKLITELIGPDARVYLANSRGDVWTDLNRAVARPPVDLVQLPGAATYRRPEGGDVLAAGAVVAGSPWSVLVEMPLDQVLTGPREVIGQMALFGLLLLVGGAATAWALSGRFTGAIRELADAAEAISAGVYTRHAAVDGADELGVLGRAFNAMRDSVAAAHRQLEEKVLELACTEEQNRRTRERLEYVVAASRAVLYRLRIDGGDVSLDWISENVKRELGYDVEETLRSGWWEGSRHPADPSIRKMLDRFPAEGTLTQEYRIRHADGQFRWVRDEQRLLRDTRGQATEIVGVMSDITEHRRLEIAKDAAESASLAKNEFLGRMSHELRTPLNAILGFGQLLEMEAQTEENDESVEQILRAGRHLLTMVDEVLDIARIEAGQMSLSVEPVSVRHVIRESVDLVRLIAAKQEIFLQADDALATDNYVSADKQRLKQVLLNLLSNAIKYNRRRGTVTISSERVGEERLRISVGDTGYGIPAGMLERLFTPFDRLGADQGAIEGTGLGLALSKGLIDAMGGSLGVESTEGEGSCFWVELPLATRPMLSGSVPAERIALELPDEAVEVTHTVLFVEDNLANVRLIERVFKHRPQVRLLTAMQGSLGLELAREHHPALIFLDLNLPGLSGDKVLIQLRQDPAIRDIPVVIVSGDAIPSQVQRMLDLGARGYITKPFNVRELLDVVDESLPPPQREAV